MQICTGIIDTFDTFLQNVKFHMPYIISLYLFDTYLTLSTNKKIESVKSVMSFFFELAVQNSYIFWFALSALLITKVQIVQIVQCQFLLISFLTYA